MIKIYTDGSCLNNPGNGGWAAIINQNGEVKEISGSVKDTTNNKMELMAPIMALKQIKQNDQIEICINALCFDKKKNKFVMNSSKIKNLINGYESIRTLSKKEKDALNVMCRGAALRYLLTRIYDYFNTPKTALIRIKDPMEYLQKLIIHNNLSHYKDYYK